MKADEEYWVELYKEGLQMDVQNQVEKKGAFDYLSWVYAVAEMLKLYPMATWGYMKNSLIQNYDSDPGYLFSDCEDGGSFVEVWLKLSPDHSTQSFPMPVLDNKNKPIVKPDCYQINTAFMRGLTKLISMRTGIGLFLYAGEDLVTFNANIKANGEQVKELADLLSDSSKKCQQILAQFYVNDPLTVGKYNEAIAVAPLIESILEKAALVGGTTETKVLNLAFLANWNRLDLEELNVNLDGKLAK